MSTDRTSLPHARFLLIGLVAGILASCGPKYPKCEKDDHCKAKGEVCVEGTCQQCREDAQCKEGERCKGGRCEPKPECAQDADCKDNQVCRSGKCQVECTSDGDCGSGMKCKDNRCRDKLACAVTTDCEGGMTCVAGRCQGPTDASRDFATTCQLPVVYFDFNEYTLSDSSRQVLQQAADCIKQKSGRIVIEGHCDERGTEEYNLVLGENRARSVQRYLTNLGVPAQKVSIQSKGELDPADPGHDESAWSKNRRSELVVQ